MPMKVGILKYHQSQRLVSHEDAENLSGVEERLGHRCCSVVHVTGGHAVGAPFLGEDVSLQEADDVFADGKHCMQSQCPIPEKDLEGSDIAAQLHGEEVRVRREHRLPHRLQAIGGVILEEQRGVAATHTLHKQLVRLVVHLSLYVCGEVEGCWIDRRGSQPQPEVVSRLRCEYV